MGSEQVNHVAEWAAMGALTLLPQSLVAVLVLVLATTEKLSRAVLGYGLALGGITVFAPRAGPGMMLALALALSLLAALMMWATRSNLAGAVPVREMAIPAVAALALSFVRPFIQAWSTGSTLIAACLTAALVLGAGYAFSPTLRAALRR